jgi:hypothetical protein
MMVYSTSICDNNIKAAPFGPDRFEQLALRGPTGYIALNKYGRLRRFVKRSRVGLALFFATSAKRNAVASLVK